MQVAVVKAAFDSDANVWYVEHSDLAGLRVEGDTFEIFKRNIADATFDLFRGEGASGEIYVEIIAHTSLHIPAAA
jgi:hypothetical protein